MDNLAAMFAIFQKGGFVMYILLFMSLFIVAIAVERYLYFKRNDSGRTFTQRFFALMEQGKLVDALALSHKTKGATAAIVNKALDGHMEDVGELSSYLDIQSGIELSKFHEHLYFLNVIVTMGPLLGLLGTITGMISAFSILNTSSGALGITNGVGEALIATATGIFVALVALVVHSYFKQRIEGIVTDMEQTLSELQAKRKGILKAGVVDHEAA
jgi:biopolymer transport protein ExbB